MKKSIYLLLTLILLLSVLVGCNDPSSDPADSTSDSTIPATSTETEHIEETTISKTNDDYEYIETSNTVTIKRYLGNKENVVIPEEIDGKTVTQIYNYAFVKSAIVSVSIPDTVTSIGIESFAYCQNLEKVELSKNLVDLQGGAFRECGKLSSIELPKSLTNLGSYAFEKCFSLKHITIPGSITDWGSYTFSESGLETLEIENGIETIALSAFCATQIKEVVLPESVRTIAWQAFAGCENLESVILNDGLTTIENWAFSAKSKLTEIVIPKTVTSITEGAFDRCVTLEKVKFEGDAPENYKNETLPETDDIGYTVYYHEDAKGFTSPEWFGYETALW